MNEITVAQNDQSRELLRGGEWECSWEKSEGEERRDYEGAWVIRPLGSLGRTSAGFEHYYPLEEKPPVYLAFAALVKVSGKHMRTSSLGTIRRRIQFLN